MKFTKKWMVVPYVESTKEVLAEALSSTCESNRINNYNQVLSNVQPKLNVTKVDSTTMSVNQRNKA